MLVSALALCTGVLLKSRYKNLNDEECPLNHFAVGVMSNDLAKKQAEIMKGRLEESPIILDVECIEESQFQYSCATQKGKIKKVFKGNELRKGDKIEICSVTSMFMEQEMKINGKFGINMNFVNEMKEGKVCCYLG